MTTTLPSFVYVIEQVSTGHVKIGVADDVYSRLKSLQTASPVLLVLRHTIICKDRKSAYAIESMWHGVYAEQRISGEWFNVPADTIVSDIERAIALAHHLQPVHVEKVEVEKIKIVKQKVIVNPLKGRKSRVGFLVSGSGSAFVLLTETFYTGTFLYGSGVVRFFSVAAMIYFAVWAGWELFKEHRLIERLSLGLDE